MSMSRSVASLFALLLLSACGDKTVVDPCAPNPCRNNGICSSDGNGGISCECATGYSGLLCTLSEAVCDPNPCMNNGKCTPAPGGFNCECPTGISGMTCDVLPPSCDPNPCQNGGSCAPDNGTIKCTCAPGYSGVTCADDIDDCASMPCKNGGVCTDGVNSYTCNCTAGFTGTTCEDVANGCNPDPCMNGGTCTADGVAYTCACLPGFTDNNCQTNIDDCAMNPCKNGGTCVDGVNTYTCNCVGDYGGANCATFIPPPATNFSTYNLPGRSCADGGEMVSYSVKTLTATSATLSTTPSLGCLSAGDEVLLINLQGTNQSIFSVGNWEVFTIASISSDTVTFTIAKQRVYGDDFNGVGTDANLGIGPTNQRVMLQRIPKYDGIQVPAGSSITASAWNGVKGGVFALRLAGAGDFTGGIDMAGKGYHGGIDNTSPNTGGQEGESLRGLGIKTFTANTGGGGGGGSCVGQGVGGAGGGYADAGGNGQIQNCPTYGGVTYGDAGLSKIFLGSGGGAGGTPSTLANSPPGGHGGAGGGIIIILSSSPVSGSISASGQAGYGDAAECTTPGNSPTDCWYASGPGGGGAGGSILVEATAFTGQTNVAGGIGGNGVDLTAGNGGNGSAGRSRTN